MNRFPLIPVEDEGRLHDPGLRENFIERVFVYHRWQKLIQNSDTTRDLIEFHTRHKYLIMAHSPKHLTTLGKIVSNLRDAGPELREIYLRALMDSLRFIATISKNTNVLHHVAGYFKNISITWRKENCSK